MKLHILIDNLPAQGDLELASEHGLALLFSLNGKKYLVDTGASGKFLQNMEQMQHSDVCSPKDVDCVVISHGHNDHTGGIRSFLESNIHAPIYLHNTIRGNLFFSCRPLTAKDSTGATANIMGNGITIKEFRSIGMEQALFAEYGHRFREIDSPTRITEEITIIPISGRKPYPTPMGNEFLYMNDFPDNFTHETAILVEHTPGEYTIISPCTHNGILNVLECCSNHIAQSGTLQQKERFSAQTAAANETLLQKGCFPAQKESQGGTPVTSCISEEASGKIKYFVGGLHYVDYLLGSGENKEAAQIAETALKLKEMYPSLKVFSGHCTCQEASGLLKNILGNNYFTFCTGNIIECI